MRKINLALVVLCSLYSFSIAPATRAQTEASAPAQSKTIQISGLTGKVTVRRDERGIPYIEATNDKDLYFAQGYVAASDRLWQMDLFRRNARGQLAEIFGTAALDEDKRHRTLGLAQAAEAEAAQAAPEVKELLSAYASGVNAYIQSIDAKSWPPEFQLLQYKPTPWTPADSLLIVKNFFEALSTTWRLDIMREGLADLPPAKRAALLPETSPLDVLVVGSDSKTKASTSNLPAYGDGLPAAVLDEINHDAEVEARSLARIGLYAENLAASNNWVVNGKHTASGKPLLANDPHLAASAPPIWYMVHLSAPGMRVAGVTAAGLPGVVIGHNDHIAWGFTNVGPDVQDVYLEKFDPQNPKRYQTPSGWRDADIRHEEIKVRKGFTDTSTDVVPLDVTVTRHGPIVLEKEGRRYALRWTALEPDLNIASANQTLNRARNWKEFTTALRSYTGPTQNMVYADDAGHIGYYAAGKVPIRKSGDGSVPYDGSTDNGEWTSYIPFEQLPHLFDPASGIIVTANQRIVGQSYPYFLTHSWAQPYRAHRILEMLQQKPKLTADDFRAIHGDVFSQAGQTFAEASVKILKGSLTPADEQLARTLAAFEKWDARLNAESAVGPVAAQMRIAFRTRIINAAIGEERARTFGWANLDTTIDWILTNQPPEWLPKDFKNYADLLRACHADARQVLTKNLGADESQWIWGNMVKARFPHPMASAPLVGLQFAVPPFPQNGTGVLLGATVNVGASVSMRLIADPGDWDKTQHGITTGESGIPNSPHWLDQLPDWRAVTPRAFPFTTAAIATATKSTIVLEPGK
ncbi:MAG TPA: penicillin acylase family protein [Pyrinomonadaceae bacterium]|nr:penicillin acylase family protein [Pyrinomonadaceae bacterium]